MIIAQGVVAKQLPYHVAQRVTQKYILHIKTASVVAKLCISLAKPNLPKEQFEESFAKHAGLAERWFLVFCHQYNLKAPIGYRGFFYF